MRTTAAALAALLALSAPGRSGAAPDFAKDVRPLLTAACGECHADGRRKGGLSMSTRADLLAGGDSGPAVVPGKAAESLLVKLAAGGDPDRVMPPKGKPLAPEQLAVLRAWVDAGAVWPENLTVGKLVKADVTPRTPAVPAVEGVTHPVDRLLDGHYRAAGGVPEPADDRRFARRVWLDLVGLLPPADELDAFEKDARPDKRERLVRRLLDDKQAYADHWLTFWNDALRNAYRGTGYIDGGRQQITGWLYRSLYENKPYDRFAHELISPVPGAEGFTKGIVWRGVVNASQRPEMQAAQNVGQVFLGTNVKCASCHDSFVNAWKLKEVYDLAAVFADKAPEIHRCDKPTGKTASPAFLFPEIGAIDPAAPKAERMRQLAGLVTSPKNGRFARTAVNRLWAVLLGRGLVEPVDEMENDPWNRDLLDWLAADFVAHGHDLKHTLALIATSRAYQAAAAGEPKPGEKAPPFRGPLVKRMTAEQFVDAVGVVTGVRPAAPAGGDARAQGGQLAAIRAIVAGPSADPAPAAKWVWSDAAAAKGVAAGKIHLRKTLRLTDAPKKATAVASADNEFTLWVNGKKVAASNNWSTPMTADLTPHLKAGENVLAIEAVNTDVGAANPAGVILAAVLTFGDGPATIVGTDATWLWSAKAADGWRDAGFAADGWKHAAEAADAGAGPWNLGPKLAAALSSAPAADGVRASVADDDALMRALGRPNREQVVTRRESVATTLQALELTNGPTLDGILRKAAAGRLARHKGAGPDAITEGLYRDALGRRPNAAELAAARELLGDAPGPAGVEDLLWAVLMLPEFQLIR